MRTTRRGLLVIALALGLAPRGLAQEAPAGRWVFEMPAPGVVELEQVALVLELGGGEGQWTVSGTVETGDGPTAVAGGWDPGTGHMSLVAARGDVRGLFELDLAGERLVGTLQISGAEIPVEAARGAPSETAPLEVDFSVPRPEVVTQAGLPEELAQALSRSVRAVVEAERVVGLSVAVVRAGELVDVRSFGWEDFGARVPATGETMYRWASISKPLTAVAALQLVESGRLDLDRDVRAYVPEFPEKAHAFTSRHLLSHQAGIVHYRDMGIRTLREYEVEHPWADPILRLDMFNERELLFEPGTAYSYTTPGFVLLGAVVERAGEGSYVEQVNERICRPLGMASMRPDYEWVAIPHRARGYERKGEGRVVDSGTDDISWKLPAGGWISTAGDLARFGAGLAGSELLQPQTREDMWTRQATADGTVTGYGLGIGVGELDGRLVVSHSGGQKKASTFLLVAPGRGTAVALMGNTEGAELARLARELIELVGD